MAAEELPGLPEDVMRTIAFLVKQKKSGTLFLNFNEGRMQTFDFKIHGKITGGWPSNNGDSWGLDKK